MNSQKLAFVVHDGDSKPVTAYLVRLLQPSVPTNFISRLSATLIRSTQPRYSPPATMTGPTVIGPKMADSIHWIAWTTSANCFSIVTIRSEGIRFASKYSPLLYAWA
jgi:hypothetical protein